MLLCYFTGPSKCWHSNSRLNLNKKNGRLTLSWYFDCVSWSCCLCLTSFSPWLPPKEGNTWAQSEHVSPEETMRFVPSPFLHSWKEHTPSSLNKNLNTGSCRKQKWSCAERQATCPKARATQRRYLCHEPLLGLLQRRPGRAPPAAGSQSQMVTVASSVISSQEHQPGPTWVAGNQFHEPTPLPPQSLH